MVVRTRLGPAPPRHRDLIAQGAQQLDPARATRRAVVAADPKAQRKATAQRRLEGNYIAWFGALFPVDAELRRLQPRGPLPVCKAVAIEFVYQLPTILPRGLSLTEMRDYMVALNTSSKAAGGAAPFSRGDLTLNGIDLDVLRRTCGVGRTRLRVQSITAEMFRNAECQISVLQRDCFHVDERGNEFMKTDPCLADPLDQLHIVERAFFTFLASGGRDCAMFNESQLYEWTVLHLGLSIANRVHSCLGMRAGMQELEPAYEPAYCELVWTSGQEGRTLGAVLQGWSPATDAWLPEAAAWLASPARGTGILSWAFRGKFILTELKVQMDAAGSYLGSHDLNMEAVALLCRSPAIVLLVHAAYYRMFVLDVPDILGRLWKGTATIEDFRMREDTPLFPRPYTKQYAGSYVRTGPAASMAARELAGPRAGVLTDVLGERTLLGFLRMPFFRAGYYEVIQLRSLRRTCLRTLQIADLLRGGSGRKGLAQASVQCGWNMRCAGGEIANGHRAYADFDSSELGVRCTKRGVRRGEGRGGGGGGGGGAWCTRRRCVATGR
jgi:hypothetical protein